MMMDISPFKKILTSLSRVSPFTVEIWNGSKPLLSYENGQDESTIKNEVKNLSVSIKKNTAFQHGRLNDSSAVFGMPLKHDEKTVGSLIAYGKKFDGNGQVKEMETFLTDLAELMEDRWHGQKEMEEMAGELTQSFEELHFYSLLDAKISTLEFSGSLLRDLIENLMEALRVDLAFARFPQREKYNLLATNANLSREKITPEDFVDRLFHRTLSDASRLDENHFILNDSREIPDFSTLHPKPFRYLAVPLRHKGEVYGWLGMLAFDLEEYFHRSELNLLSTMAKQIAMIIANTDLYRDMERFVINIVKSLVHAIEVKDVYTRGHSERVNRYCMMMADRLDLDKQDKKNLHWASILHDIGKIGVPETILNKPDKLDHEEYDLVKNHSQKGYDILKPIEQLAGSLPGILYHHERYDGKGYPEGLKGEAIPLHARIIAVADTFDAITSDRAYRSGRHPENALSIMKHAAGSQLDAELFEIFQKIYRDQFGFRNENAHVNKSH
jgi:HD-GYP domain-containing protein (c-di-GMP phosphodiesterase class II)